MILRALHSRAPFFKCSTTQGRFSRIPHLRPAIRTPPTMSACVASRNNAAHRPYLYLPHLTRSLLSMFSPSLAAVPGLSPTRDSVCYMVTEPSQHRRSTLLKRPRNLRRIPQLTGTSGQKIRCVINTCRTRYNPERIRIIAVHRHRLWYIQTKRTLCCQVILRNSHRLHRSLRRRAHPATRAGAQPRSRIPSNRFPVTAAHHARWPAAR
jgi:hypothetical protein